MMRWRITDQNDFEPHPSQLPSLRDSAATVNAAARLVVGQFDAFEGYGLQPVQKTLQNSTGL